MLLQLRLFTDSEPQPALVLAESATAESRGKLCTASASPARAAASKAGLNLLELVRSSLNVMLVTLHHTHMPYSDTHNMNARIQVTICRFSLLILYAD